MPVPTSDELLKKQQEANDEYIAAINQNSEKLASAKQAAADTYTSLATLNNKRVDAAGDALAEDVGKINGEQTQYFADLLKQRGLDVKKAEAEDAELTEGERKAAAWTGATELAAAIANMVGVGSFNASNQKYHSFSQDWMKKADENRKARRKRMDDLRERQNAAGAQLSAIKASGAKDLAQLRARLVGEKAARDNSVLGVKFKADNEVAAAEATGRQAAAEATAKGKQAEISLGLKEQTRSDANRQHEDALLAQGFKRGKDGNLEVDPDIVAARAAARGRTTSSGGRGSSIQVTFAASGENPEETMTINAQSLYNTILANKEDLGLTKDEQKEVLRLIGSGGAEDTAKILTAYATKNKKLRDLVRKSAVSSTYDPGNPPIPYRPATEDDDETGNPIPYEF